MPKQVAPKLNADAFSCPHCGAFAHQHWDKLSVGGFHEFPEYHLSLCSSCWLPALWRMEQIVYPGDKPPFEPHPEMPADVVLDYEEARSVFAASPRSSAALLRLALQKLVLHLGLAGRNLNEDIGQLVARGLPMEVQQSLDIVRVIGNNQVHPGVLDIRDNVEAATTLFELLNFIVEDRIARPRKIQSLYDKLPEGAKNQITDRDKKPAIQ